MDITAHLFDIVRATDDATLLTYRTDALNDDCLNADEKVQICHAIEKRFAFLNATVAERQKPRWK